MKSCQRCGKETNITIMSMFSTAIICLDCSDAERKHPDYLKAREADEAAIRTGNYNFKGIGEPKKKD